jgi:hypothetical protein
MKINPLFFSCQTEKTPKRILPGDAAADLHNNQGHI